MASKLASTKGIDFRFAIFESFKTRMIILRCLTLRCGMGWDTEYYYQTLVGKCEMSGGGRSGD